MTTKIRWTLALAVAGLFAAGCEHGPTAPADAGRLDPDAAVAAMSPATRTVTEKIYDMTGLAYVFRCLPDGTVGGDESIRLEGRIYERFTHVVDPTGGYHVRWHIMLLGLRGFSDDTGEEFRITEHDQGTWNETKNGESGTYRYALRLVGRDTGRSFLAVYSGHFRVMADGEVVVDRHLERLECRL